MRPIIIKERTPVISGYEDIDDVWSYERIMEIWGEDSEELTPMLAKRCKELEEKNCQLARQIKEAQECIRMRDYFLASDILGE